MAPFEALYSSRCRSSTGWFDAFEVRPRGTYLLRESLNKVKFIKDRLHMAYSRQKSYANMKVCDLEFMVGEKVLLKVLLMKGVMRFGRKGNLSPRYIGPFKIVVRIGEVAYQLALPPGLSSNLTFEEESITIFVRKLQNLRSKEIASVKIRWKHRIVEEATLGDRFTHEK
ncbi:uncharacterized protein [Solanum lycopersicum]|uniref:uncharacterized protein n=1 Tax=Solanum lycopersicum TaxID=4081 RepID=UPI000532C342